MIRGQELSPITFKEDKEDIMRQLFTFLIILTVISSMTLVSGIVVPGEILAKGEEQTKVIEDSINLGGETKWVM